MVDELTAALVSKNSLEVDAVLRSVGSDQTPPGWWDFSETAKRRTLRPLLAALSVQQVRELWSEYVAGDREETRPPEEAPSARLVPAWKPIYTDARAYQEAAQKYGLTKADLESRSPKGSAPDAGPEDVLRDAPIFVVHGRDTRTESVVQRLIERTTGRDAVVLHEQAGGGRTIVEQLESHGPSAAYAVVLLTADDQGGIKGGDLQPRARQNVVLELGYFWGVFGRENVAVLVEDGVELPSDAHGIHYISLDAGGGWKAKLLQELQSAGMAVDWKRMPS